MTLNKATSDIHPVIICLACFWCIYRGQNPLHILSQYAKDNAVAIFELFRQSMPDYPINALDADGNIGKLFQEINSLL